MDRHEPKVHITPTQEDTEVSAAKRFINGVGNYLTPVGRKITAAGVAGILSITLAGCGAQANAEGPEPTTSTSVEAEPSEAPTPTESEKPEWYNEEDVMERSPLPEELKKYQDMSVDEFGLLPKSEQWLYVSWLTQYRDQFEEWFAVASGDWQSKPFDLTPDSPIEQKIEDRNYTYRMGAGTTIETPEPKQDLTCGDLDQDDMQKIYIAQNYNVDRALKDANDVYANQEGKAYCPSGLAIGNSFDSGAWSFDNQTPIEREIDGKPVQGVTLDYSIDGATKQMEVYVIETPTYDGKTAYRTITNYLAGPMG